MARRWRSPYDARARIVASREYIERLVAEGRTVYGVTTGFGKLANVRIAPADVQQLQRNLVRSHAMGVGEPLSQEVVRAMLLLRAQSLSLGYSGIRVEVIELLIGDAQSRHSSGDSVAGIGRRERRPGAAGAHGAGADRRR